MRFINIVYTSCVKKRYLSKQIPPFKKILIANRGEIAIRIINSCKKLGIETVAIYSDADKDSLYTKFADESIHIGRPESVDSYLNVDKILEACKKTKAEAVHPGYGFLSEKHWFASKLNDNGITFIGPSVKSLRLMGDKLESKRIAKTAGVSIVPGFDGLITNEEQALKIAHEIGYPVMVKAAGGGGGKGMRIAQDDHQLKEGYILSKQEAKSSFNDDRIIIEKFIEDPHHIEFQILGDTHGNIIHLNERECSIQRRNQKLLEEAPSPSMNAETRLEMAKQAKSLAKAVGYYSAGTVEFLMDKKGLFYFLEMNTRLQVEHPVTEQITGVDIVEQMIKVAAGHKLDYQQDDIKINGWALECRVNAENPFKNFGIPSTGRLIQYKEPAIDGNLRIDSGIVEGSEISVYYDSMISKLIATGKTRNDAIERMKKALDSYIIRGPHTNIPLLRDIIDHPTFKSGNFTTGFLTQTYGTTFKPKCLSQTDRTVLILTGIKYYLNNLINLNNPNSFNFNLNEINQLSKQCLVVSFENEEDTFEIKDISIDLSSKYLKMKINNNSVESNWSNIDNNWKLCNCTLLNNKDIDNTPEHSNNNQNNHIVEHYNRNFHVFTLKLHGLTYNLKIMTRTEFELQKYMKLNNQNQMISGLYAPMSGLVISIACKDGDMLESGHDLMVVEAMKMQNNLSVSQNTKIKKILVKKGDKVSEGDLLIEFE